MTINDQGGRDNQEKKALFQGKKSQRPSSRKISRGLAKEKENLKRPSREQKMEEASARKKHSFRVFPPPSGQLINGQAPNGSCLTLCR